MHQRIKKHLQEKERKRESVQRNNLEVVIDSEAEFILQDVGFTIPDDIEHVSAGTNLSGNIVFNSSTVENVLGTVDVNVVKDTLEELDTLGDGWIVREVGGTISVKRRV